MSAHIDYNNLPEVIDLCYNCRKASCETGQCHDLIRKIYELKGKPVPKRLRPPSGRTRNVAKYEIDGVKHTLWEWCGIYGKNYNTVYARMLKGRSLKDALTDPINESQRRTKKKTGDKT